MTKNLENMTAKPITATTTITTTTTTTTTKQEFHQDFRFVFYRRVLGT